MNILLVTPPFCQLNTPYPATAFLKSWLDFRGYTTSQVDGGLEVFLDLFSQKKLQEIFNSLNPENLSSDRSMRVYALKAEYLKTIDTVISFLQGKDLSLATLICRDGYLPEGDRFLSNNPEKESFGSLGITDLARYRATLYLEDLGDFIKDEIDGEFGFSKYAEHIALSPPSFKPLNNLVHTRQKKKSPIDLSFEAILKNYIEKENPQLLAFTVPFPGNLLQALMGAYYIKKNYSSIKIAIGGGYVNTELRSLSDPLFFEFFDFVNFDDGEDSLLSVCDYLDHKIPKDKLIRTLYCENKKIIKTQQQQSIFSHKKRQAPSYKGLPFDKYLSLFDRQNPMHRLWSEGPWIKMMLAHGCYWKRCAFCDTSLDYIERYEPQQSTLIVDQIEQLIEETGYRSFHFVDEAAPPALLKGLSLELLKRKISITWWTNIRFEKQFSPGLSQLMGKAGCIALSGGLEVASDNLLQRMDKGVNLRQIARVTKGFSDAGIMVHAYLMYGFPGQSPQELIDALEMVRQLFAQGFIQSAFWHCFALTQHSVVGQNPKDFGVTITGPAFDGFAQNDLTFIQEGVDLSSWGPFLERALYNFMRGQGLNIKVHKWFDIPVPRPKVDKSFIEKAGKEINMIEISSRSSFLFLEPLPQIDQNYLIFRGNSYQEKVECNKESILFTYHLLQKMAFHPLSFQESAQLAEEYDIDFNSWLDNDLGELLEYGIIYF